MTPQQRAKTERSTTVLAKAAQKSQETVVQSLAAMKVSMNNTLDTIANSVSAELATLKDVQEAVEVKRSELKALYQIEAQANSLNELDERIAATRLAWADEQSTKQVSRDRQEEEYKYELAKKRRDDQEQFQAKLDAEVAVKRDQFAVQTASLDLRMAAIAAKEEELNGLRTQVNSFEERLKKEVSAAVAIATNSLKKDLTNDFKLQELQLQNKVSLQVAEIDSLNSEVASLNMKATRLEAAAQEATLRVQSIAEKAIEGAAQAKVVLQQNSESSSKR